MTSKCDSINSSDIAVKLQIINHDPIIHSSKETTVATDASTPDKIENNDNVQCNSCQKLPQHYHKTKRKRDYKHDDNAIIYISQYDLDAINASSSDAADVIDSDNGDNGHKKDKMHQFFDGMTCRLSKTAAAGSSSLQILGNPTEKDRNVPVGGNVGNAIIDPLWAPVILRVLTPSILNKLNIEIDPEENNGSNNISVESIPTIFITPCISATIGIYWFHRNNTTMMMAYLQPLKRQCIVTASSATIREIGRLSPLLMMDDTFYNWNDDDDDDGGDDGGDHGDIVNVNSSERTNDNDNNKDSDRSRQSNGTRRSEDDEEKQLRQFFLSKRYINKEQQNPSYQSNYTSRNNSKNNSKNNIIWKPRQRLLTVGSIFATPVITTYCDCYNRIFHRGNCKEYINNIRYYQVVDVTCAQHNTVDTVVSDDEGDDTKMIHSQDRTRGRGEELAYIVSPMTHLTLQPSLQYEDKLHEIGYTWRLPRPSFTLSYLQSVHDNNGSSSTKEKLAFGCVSNQMSISNPNTIYHPSAKLLSGAIYLQGIIVGSMMKNNVAFQPSNIGPRIVHVVGESENNVRGCIDEAADMMGMRTLHVGGLAAFLAYYNSTQTHNNTRAIFTGGLADKLKGLAVALDIANQSSPCVLHIESIDHELTPTTGQMADASGRDEEERRILQVIRDKTVVSSSECFETTSPVIIEHDLFSSSYATPKVIVVFSTSNPLPPGPISSSLQQPSVTIDPPDRKYAKALWSDDEDGTFESLSMSLLGLSATDISYLRQMFVQKWNVNGGNDVVSSDDSEIYEVTPMSILEPLLNELETIRSFTQRSRNSGGGGGSSTLPLSTSSLPNVRWEDIGGMEHIRKEIMDAVELPLKYPQFFVGSRRSGILLFGPPGTGKTLVAKAVARECGLPFLSIKGPELLGSYVGESEANIRAVFDAARSAAQHSGGGGSGGYSGASVLFFDELDSLAPRRGETGFGDGVMDRVVSTLLGELDGGEMKSSTTKDSAESHVIVIGATNRPDLLDPSLLRPGRFDRLLYLGPAKTKETMLQILKAQTRKFKFEPGCDADTILRKAMESFPPTLSGADLSAVASKALMRGLKRVCDRVEKEAESLNLTRDPSELEIGVDDVMESWSKEKLEPYMCVEDFVEAAKTVIPSISHQDLENFEKLQRQFASR